MADDAPALPASPAACAGDGDPPSPSVPVPRVLPPSLFLDAPPPSIGRARVPRGGRASGSGRGRGRGGGGRGTTKSALPAAAPYGAGGRRPSRLVEAIMKVPAADVGAGRASADILHLAMAKGPMFEWLSYWPENGFPKEDHPY